MPSFDKYKKRLGRPKTIGKAHKLESDKVMEWTWYNDIDAKTAYFYTQDRDSEFRTRNNLHPERTKKIPIEIKFFEMEYNSLSKDEVAYHIVFKPSFIYQEYVPYYDKEFAEPLGASWPVGMYCDISDSQGKYNRWLVVGQYRQYSNQFPSYLVLPCDHLLQWIYQGKKYESWSVLRSQSSYNSGVWIDYKITSPENQKIVWLPFNDITKTLFYDQRLAISEPRREPICWSLSKVEDTNVRGIARCTFKQDRFNGKTDYIEKDEDGNIVGIWCDYYINGDVAPVPINEQPSSLIHSVITCSGLKPDIKAGGNYKKFTVTFYNEDEVIQYRPGHWTYTIDGVDVSSKITTLDSTGSTDVAINQVKAKLEADDNLIGKILIVGFESNDGIKSEMEINIVGR